jgi:uncharacterized protein
MNKHQPTLKKRLELQARPQKQTPLMYHKWRNILFLHWEFDPHEIQSTLPKGLTVDTYDGRAYLGVVPFIMQAVRPRFFPSLPFISNFLELNLRTYVYDDQANPGVWFYSLDANQKLAVEIARRFYGLPYFHASMKAELNDKFDFIRFSCLRRDVISEYRSTFSYRGAGKIYQAEPDSLEFFMVERYLLFSKRGTKLYRGKVHHHPYPLMEAEVHQWDEHLFHINGFKMPERPPDHMLYSGGVDVQVYVLE